GGRHRHEARAERRVALRPAASANVVGWHDEIVTSLGRRGVPYRRPRGESGRDRRFALLDYLVCPQQQRRRDREAECLRRLHVDDEFERRRLLHREIARLRALEDPFDENHYVLNHGRQAWTIGDEASRVRELS